jgi:hypothetical protein
MLKSKNMSKEFWVEAVRCAIYLQNRCPTVSLENITPQEAWCGVKPSVAHLKVFGSVAYAHVPDQKRTKLDDKSKKLIFIDYDDKSKAYNIYDPLTKKVHVNCDVQVNEESIWNLRSMEEMSHEEKKATSTIISTSTSTTTSITSQAEPYSPLSDDEDEPRTPNTRSLREIYEVTSELHLVCLLTDTEDITFEQAVKDKKWQAAMQEDMKAIEKNDTWELATLSKGHKPIGVK